ncbi:hypothetical protein [Nocardioides sambongensis]|uniref:hypothetical protein n=1 Tax=Nocardioides sambongensis TaxID=2589074 RepID=UPI0015E840BA|nr:hypothetical protein [Nocardioides sambongensis]
MRFTEHELTAALTGAAKNVHAAQDKQVRKGQRTADEAWEELGKFQRFQLLDGLGDQLLPVLVALPDVEIPSGERATYTDDEIRATVEERLGEERGLRRKALLAARVALVKLAIGAMPPRADPDALIVPDHL